MFSIEKLYNVTIISHSANNDAKKLIHLEKPTDEFGRRLSLNLFVDNIAEYVNKCKPGCGGSLEPQSYSEFSKD